MAEIVITYVGATSLSSPADYEFSPCFHAEQDGGLLLKAWVQLSRSAADRLQAYLSALNADQLRIAMHDAMLRYGVQRIEQAIAATVHDNVELPDPSAVWRLDDEDLPMLTTLINGKVCDYQAREGRDYFCTAAKHDDVAVHVIDGRRSAPTSIPLCNKCSLPSTDYVCSSLSHPRIYGVTDGRGQITGKRISTVLCNSERTEVRNTKNCHAGGHECWRRTIIADNHTGVPRSAPNDLPDAIDTLSTYWRLALGNNRRLVSLHTTAGAAELAMDCTTREEFKSRLSALADFFDKLKVDDDLLPRGLTNEQRTGSLNQIESCLKHQMPPEYAPTITRSLRTLRQVRRVRVAMQHTGGNTGLAIELDKLGIHGVPMDWAAAWDQIRAVCADAIHDLRRDIGRWVN